MTRDEFIEHCKKYVGFCEYQEIDRHIAYADYDGLEGGGYQISYYRAAQGDWDEVYPRD